MRLLFVLAAVLFLSVHTDIDASEERKSPWIDIALADIDAIYQLIKENHPGPPLCSNRKISYNRRSYVRPALLSGNSRTRLPDAAKYALTMAGAIGGTPGSPTPPGGASDSIMWL